MSIYMAPKSNLFVDSNFFIALYNAEDSLHIQAQATASHIIKADCSLYISNYVLFEVLSVLSQKTGRQQSIMTGQNIINDAQITIIHINEALQQRTWEVFQEVTGKNISFVDCSTVAVMQYAGIRQLLTFDITDFKPLCRQFGLRLFEG